MRDEILRLLNGEKISSVPAFSGLIHVTTEGLASEGLSLQEVHHDAEKMARASASTFKLTGMPSAALPLDLCSPAEALGAENERRRKRGLKPKPPTENYYGWLVNDRLEELKALFR